MDDRSLPRSLACVAQNLMFLRPIPEACLKDVRDTLPKVDVPSSPPPRLLHLKVAETHAAAPYFSTPFSIKQQQHPKLLYECIL